MGDLYFWAGFGVALAILVVAVLAWLVFSRFSGHTPRGRWAAARESFQLQREWLEVRFIEIASRDQRPRGLTWLDCEFDNPVVFARSAKNGRLAAFVPVYISFEAIPDGGMEEVEAVSNIRAATAVFHFGRGQWSTLGRVVYNLPPAEAAARFGFDPLDTESESVQPVG